MNKWIRNLSVSVALIGSAFVLTACPDDAKVAEENLNKAADNFEIMRRVVLHNTIRGENIMVTEGLCSVEPGVLRTSVICKVGPEKYIRNFYGDSDNSLYIVEQMEAVPVNVYHYRRTFKPQILIPDVDLRFDVESFGDAVTPDSSD